MFRVNRRSAYQLVAGITLGLSLGLAVAAGVYLGQRNSNPLEELRLRAASAHGASTFSMATGPIDDDAEGLFCLDFITGDLNCYVLNSRNGKLGGWFKTNVFSDLAVEKGKAPAFTMVTGGFNLRGVSGNARPIPCVVYVGDANTGLVVGYSFNWNATIAAAGGAQALPMNRVFAQKARADLRE